MVIDCCCLERSELLSFLRGFFLLSLLSQALALCTAQFHTFSSCCLCRVSDTRKWHWQVGNVLFLWGEWAQGPEETRWPGRWQAAAKWGWGLQPAIQPAGGWKRAPEEAAGQTERSEGFRGPGYAGQVKGRGHDSGPQEKPAPWKITRGEGES